MVNQVTGLIPSTSTPPPIVALFDDQKGILKEMERRYEKCGYHVIASDKKDVLEGKIGKLKTLAIADLDLVTPKNARAGLDLAVSIRRRFQGCFIRLTTGHMEEAKRYLGDDLNVMSPVDEVVLKGTDADMDLRQFRLALIQQILAKVAREMGQTDPALDPPSVYAGLTGALGDKDRSYFREHFPMPISTRRGPLDDIYRRLKANLSSSRTAKADSEYRRLIEQLRGEQAKEARLMRKRFDDHTPLTSEKAAQLLQRLLK